MIVGHHRIDAGADLRQRRRHPGIQRAADGEVELVVVADGKGVHHLHLDAAAAIPVDAQMLGPHAQREALVSYAKQNGISELSIPRTLLQIDEIPLLGTGKVDYVTLKTWVESRLEA